MADFTDLLDRKVEDTEQPPVLPGGTWRLRLISVTHKEWTGKGNADYRDMFVYVPVEPLEDVDADSVSELTDEDLEAARLFYGIFLGDKRDEYALKVHIEKHGVDLTGRTYGEVYENFAGAEILGYVTEDVAKDGETPINNIESFVKV